jgi:tRNA A-37 threonylcarbamoyl transferase component Bud32
VRALEGTEQEAEDNAPTVRASGVRLRTPVKSSAAPTPAQTLRAEELDRTRSFLQVVVGLSGVVAGGSFFLRAHVGLRVALMLGLLGAVGTSLWLLHAIRRASAYTPERALVTGLACMIAAFTGVAFFGVFSPAVVIVPFGLYFFSLGQSQRAVYAIAACCGLSYPLLVLLAHAGVLPDGVFPTGFVAPGDQIVIVLLVLAVMMATLVAARATRGASLRGVERHDRLVRELAQREVLLEDARKNLEAALARGGVGRYTDEVLGSYRLGAVIGQGGMGEVYEAYALDVPEAAAVKVLRPELLREPAVVRRFLREARMCASLAVPNVVRVYQIGGIEAATPYIAMERLYGRDLDSHLCERGRVSIGEVVELVRQVGRALDAAAAAGIVHRDLKPRNLFLAEQPSGERIWKVLDFGVAKLASTRDTLTQGRIIGTPAYMAPEQASGVVTFRSDLYALGVICYRALTGHAPFRGETFADTLYQLMATMPPKPSEIARELPATIDAVLSVAMAKQPSDRFGSAAELADALESASSSMIDERLWERARRLLTTHPWGGPSTAPHVPRAAGTS